MEPVSSSVQHQIDSGRKALKQTEWTKARNCFESAVREKETPEAFEL